MEARAREGQATSPKLCHAVSRPLWGGSQWVTTLNQSAHVVGRLVSKLVPLTGPRPAVLTAASSVGGGTEQGCGSRRWRAHPGPAPRSEGGDSSWQERLGQGGAPACAARREWT